MKNPLPLHTKRRFDKKDFILAEKLDDYRTACLAQAEYWAEGYCCRKQPVDIDTETTYYIWLGPERLRKIRTLPGEEIRRVRGTRILKVS